MKCKTIIETVNSKTNQARPAGSIVDHPEAYKLVRHGVAESADEECAARVNRTPEQLKAAQESYGNHFVGDTPADEDQE